MIYIYIWQTKIILLLSFLFGCFYFFCLIALARTASTTMLNRSSESRQPCLVPDLRGKALNLSPLSMMVAVNLLCMALLC